jgi:hypothetical protein
MIKARLKFEGRDAGVLARAVDPDNLPEFVMNSDGNSISFEMAFQKIGTLLSTLDDLLMNLKIAEEIYISGEKR